VRNRVYPGPEHTVYMPEDERDKLHKALAWTPRS
jgi:hypothetical protein